MTVIYTETHLTSDPIIDKDTAIFNVALSSISVQCQVHREENLEYIKRNQLRAGDLIRLHGVFLTETESKSYYIKISSMALMTHLKLGKKRKIEHHVVDPILLSTMEDGPEFATAAAAAAVSTTESISLSPSSLANETQGPSGMMFIASEKNEAMQPPFVEVEGEFSDYFFMLYGKAHYVCQCLADHIQNSNRQMTTQDEIKRQLEACQIENMGQLYDLLSQIYARFIELSRQGLEKLSVIHYVNIVKNFIDKMNNLQRSFHHVLPYGLVIDHRVPLPSVIYHFYFQVI